MNFDRIILNIMLNIGQKSQVASIDVDSQYCFTHECKDELPVPDALSIVPELNLQATFTKFRIGTKDAHSPHAKWVSTKEHPPLSPLKAKNMDVYWPVHCVPGTKGFKLIHGLPHPSEYDFFVWKGVEPDMHPYGGCYHDLDEKLSTGIIEFLKLNKVKTVIIGGLATDYCVKATVLQLLAAQFNCVVNLGACRGLEEKTIQEAISEMKINGAKFINSAKELNI